MLLFLVLLTSPNSTFVFPLCTVFSQILHSTVPFLHKCPQNNHHPLFNINSYSRSVGRSTTIYTFLSDIMKLLFPYFNLFWHTYTHTACTAKTVHYFTSCQSRPRRKEKGEGKGLSALDTLSTSEQKVKQIIEHGPKPDQSSSPNHAKCSCCTTLGLVSTKEDVCTVSGIPQHTAHATRHRYTYP